MPNTRKDGNGNHGYVAPVAWIAVLVVQLLDDFGVEFLARADQFGARHDPLRAVTPPIMSFLGAAGPPRRPPATPHPAATIPRHGSPRPRAT